jgi:hypothetical protein
MGLNVRFVSYTTESVSQTQWAMSPVSELEIDLALTQSILCVVHYIPFFPTVLLLLLLIYNDVDVCTAFLGLR